MRRVSVLFLVFFLCVGGVAVAQEARVEALELSASGAEYLKAIRYRGIDTDVRYYDPTGPAPALETDAAPEQEEGRGWDLSFDFNRQSNVVVVALLAILLLVILVSLGRVGTSVSFRKEVKNTKRKAAGRMEEEEPEEALPPDINAILRQPDRQQALVRLSQLVLTRCLNAHGVLFQRSWTQREALHRLPNTLPQMSDLRALVLDSERVSFGGRQVSDREFQAHVSRIRPLLQGLRQ